MSLTCVIGTSNWLVEGLGEAARPAGELHQQRSWPLGCRTC